VREASGAAAKVAAAEAELAVWKQHAADAAADAQLLQQELLLGPAVLPDAAPLSRDGHLPLPPPPPASRRRGLLFAGVGGTALAVALACGRAAEQARDAALAVVAKLDRALADEHAARVAQAHALAGGRRAAHRLALVEGKLEAAEAAARALKHALSQAETRALGFQVGSDTKM
jgi:hypothetical protein